LLVYSLVCYLIINTAIFSSERDLGKLNVKDIKANIRKNFPMYLLMLLTSITIRKFIIYITGIETNNIWYIDLFAYILLISYVMVNLIFIMVHLYRSKTLKVNMFISIYIKLEKNLSYQNIHTLLLSFNLFFIVKYLLFVWIINPTFNKYNVLNFDNDTTDQDADHDSVSDTGWNDNSGGSGNGGPNEDIVLPDVSDREASYDESSYTGYKSGFNLGCDETLVKYEKIDDIPSHKWGRAFWNNENRWKGWAYNKIGSVSPNLIQTEVDKKITLKHLSAYDLMKYDPILKTIEYTTSKYNIDLKTSENVYKTDVLFDSKKSGFLDRSYARRITTEKLNEKNFEYTDQIVVEKGNIYHKAYFDNVAVMACLSWSNLGEGEFSYYKGYSSLLNHYFSQERGFSVQAQTKDSDGIWDFAVRVLDPRTPKLVKPMMGIEGTGRYIKEDLYNQVHTLVEIKEPEKNLDYNSKQKQPWLSVLGQLQRYHVNSTNNTNAFSIAAVGTRIAFFIYAHDIHSNFANKGKEYNGFLCLVAKDDKVEILEQFDDFGPQIVWYDLTGDSMFPREDKHSIHMIFSYLRLNYGIPHITYVDQDFKLSDAPVSKYLEKSQPVYKNDSNILKHLEHNGMLKVFISN
jgi:hypothetical protein